MDTLAARLREAFLGTETGEAVPFDELKDAVRDRWQRVADAARQVPPEGIALAAARERGHRAALRVPFSDDQIERMAKAFVSDHGSTDWDSMCEQYRKNVSRSIRAALAAGGLEPCAVPDYDPDDVALRPAGHVLRDRLVEAEAKIERQRAELKRLNALVADLRAEVDEDNANAASVNDLLVQVQNLTAERDRLRVGWENSHKAEEELETALAQLGAQEIELADLRFYQREFAAVSAERDALRERASVPVKVRIAQPAGMMEFRWLEICRKYGPENDVDACPWLEAVLCDFADYLAAHAVIDAPAGVPSVEELIGAARSARPDYAIDAAQVTAIRDAVLASVPSAPTDDQVEALARVLHKSQDAFYCRYGDHATKFDDHTPLWSTMARAALAHMSKRPEVSTKPVDLWAVITSIVDVRVDCDGCDYVEIDRTSVSDLEVALRPWLRDPVGWELDVTAEDAAMAYKDNVGGDGLLYGGLCAMLALCRSRIRPVYECKECAKKDTRIDMYDRQQNMMAKSIEVQRQGLERAAAAARAALEGE